MKNIAHVGQYRNRAVIHENDGTRSPLSSTILVCQVIRVRLGQNMFCVCNKCTFSTKLICTIISFFLIVSFNFQISAQQIIGSTKNKKNNNKKTKKKKPIKNKCKTKKNKKIKPPTNQSFTEYRGV